MVTQVPISGDYRDYIYVREYANDVPAQKDLAWRVAQAAIPFLILNHTLRFPLCLLMNSLRIVNSTGSERWRAVAALAFTILNHPVGTILTTIDDTVIEIKALYLAKDRWEASLHLVKIGNNLLYLSLYVYGGLELCLLSCAMNAVVSLLSSVDQFKQDRWIEGIAHLLMSMVRLHQFHHQYAQVKKTWEIEKILKEFFGGILNKNGDRSAYGNSTLLSEIFIKRHSGSNFEDRPLTEDQINALIQAARWAPSSYNDQPWNFIFCDRYTHPEAYAKIVESFYGQEWAENAPLLVISVVRPKFSYNQKENQWAQYDTGAAVLSMSLQATIMGLMTHQIGGFDPEAIQQDFNLPEGYQPITITAIGYEGQSSEFPEKPRTRLPEEDNFFAGKWGEKFNWFKA